MSTIVSLNICLCSLIYGSSSEEAEASNKVLTLIKFYISLGLLFNPPLVCVFPTQV